MWRLLTKRGCYHSYRTRCVDEAGRKVCKRAEGVRRRLHMDIVCAPVYEREQSLGAMKQDQCGPSRRGVQASGVDGHGTGGLQVWKSEREAAASWPCSYVGFAMDLPVDYVGATVWLR